MPINLKKLYVVSYNESIIVKVPFNCIFEHKIMNYTELPWYETIGQNLISSMEITIGGYVVDKIECNDPNSHTGKYLDKRTCLIYELATYTI